MNDMSIVLGTKIDTSATQVAKLEEQIKVLSKQIKTAISVKLSIDSKDIQFITEKINEAQKKASVSGKNLSKIKVFDREKLEEDGRQFYMSANGIVNRIKKDFKSLGDVNVDIFKNAKGQITGFNAEVKKLDGTIEKLRFDQAKIKTGNSTQKGFVLSNSLLNDTNAGNNLNATLNKLQQYQTKIDKIKESFSSSAGVKDQTNLTRLNTEYSSILNQIEKVRKSQAYMSDEQKRNIDKQINSLTSLSNKYKNIENVQKNSQGKQATTAQDVSGVVKLQQSLEKIQQKYSSIKSGISDPLKLQELNTQFDVITNKITELKNKTASGVINKSELINNKTQIGQLNHELDLMAKKYKDLQGSTSGTKTNVLNSQAIENEIQKINNSLARLKVNKDKVFADTRVSTEVDKLTQMEQSFKRGEISAKTYALQMDNIRTKVAQVSGEFQNITKDGYNFTQMIELAAKKIVIWAISTQLIYGSLRKIQEGLSFIEDMNKVFVNLQMEMTNTKLVFSDITKIANDYAVAMGSTTANVMKAISVFGTYTSTMDEVLQKSKAAIILSNITGQNVEQTADALMGTLAQFNLQAEDSMHVADIITGTARQLQLDYPRAIQEISDGLRTVGSVAKESKVPIELLSSMLGTLTEKTRRSGTEIANSLNFGAIAA